MEPGTPEEWVAITTAFIQRHVESAKAGGVVIGLSGGLDSAVVSALAVKALGPKRVVGLTMPSPDSDPADRDHALLAAKPLGIEVIHRPIDHLVAGFDKTVGPLEPHVRGNAKSRSRMMLLYAEAQSRGWLVIGTGNKSEILTGYFTKHGDGGVDLQPIGDLYKTQVIELAKHLGIPASIVSKPPSAGLRAGQTDEQDLGISYPNLDKVLKGLELNHDVATIATRTGLPLPEVARIASLVQRTEHKRRLALIPKIGTRTVGHDWRRPVQ